MERLPNWFYVGLASNLIGWSVSWLAIEPFSYYTFFLIWGGFIFILDGLNYSIRGDSLLTRNKKAFFFLFLISSLFWWYFEVVVIVTKNWYYISGKTMSIIEHQILGSIYFSTIIPAVFEITELISNIIRTKQIKFIKLGKRTPYIFFILGIFSLIIPIFYPEYFFPFIWMALYFILDPINYWNKQDSLVGDAIKNNWKRATILAISTLIAGLFWEMWNSHSDPKWVYAVPYVGTLKVFEMPILGFLGYIPFAFEIFAFYIFIRNIFKFPKAKYWLLETVEFRESIALKPNLILLFLVLFIFLFNGLFGFSEYMININYNSSGTISVGNCSPPTIESYDGKTVTCLYGLIQGTCFQSIDGNVYWLINENGDSPKFAPEHVQIQGERKEKIVGLDTIKVEGICKYKNNLYQY